MSYFPDYRTKANYDKLSPTDKSKTLGYAYALAQAKNSLDNLAFEAETHERRKAIEKTKAALYNIFEANEIEFWEGIIDSASYELEGLENADEFKGGIFHSRHPDTDGLRWTWETRFTKGK